MIIKTCSSNQTIEVAKKIALNLVGGDVILLRGDLASGKTTFTKGIGEVLGIKRVINSPTFTIVKEYKGKIKLNHIDLYRLDGGSGDFELDEYLNEDSICVIEWPDILSNMLPSEYLDINISRINELERTIDIKAVGKRYEDILKNMGD